MTEKITIDKTIIDNLVVKANVEPTGNTNDWNITNPAWVDGYKEGMLQAVNAVMIPIYLADHQPAFVVGEYYCGGNVIYKVLEVEEYPDTKDIKLKVLMLNSSEIHEDALELTYPFNDDKPATAEQIATFQRAEHFASKGRKLDEFRVGDMCRTVDGYMYTIGTDYYIAKVSKDEAATLIQTAEELKGDQL
ncbi:hypothetical protein JZO86_06055 [Enterococcus ureasiticus]|uniref:hypothetical protein n=1 Tax=Enterococcus ureasiticus TaxID=903984 RepID=UPI001A8E0C20|nr:hypothetical protein [Enterococcus ureasiticus]MBO0473263.1 hypothetical protein [Enterococcus ureasiticus]